MRFEEKLHKQMLLKGFNQRKLAKASQVSDSEVSRILRGESTPGLENALRLARAVGVSLDYLADDALEVDTARGGDQLDVDEQDVLDLTRDLSPRIARRILESAVVLGPELAIRRLHGAERPVIEVGNGMRPPKTAPVSQVNSA
ncbi:MAG: helix-turn-helix domain-containing protein [Isosphaeraceae bacterium]